MIDFHVIHRSKKSPYFDEAISSLGDNSVYLLEDTTDQGYTRMQAYSMGTNPYVSFCDDDDVIQNIEKVTDYLRQNDVNALYTNSDIVNAEGNLYNRFYKDDHCYSYEELIRGRMQIHQLVVIKREIAERAAIAAYQNMKDLGISKAYDYAFFFEVARLTNWTYLPEVCYKWRKWNSTVQLHYRLNNDPTKIRKYYETRYNLEQTK
jgi:glycosyltransferase involved in cell wall biosynthesis